MRLFKAFHFNRDGKQDETLFFSFVSSDDALYGFRY